MEVYSVAGGVPKYFEFFDNEDPLIENLPIFKKYGLKKASLFGTYARKEANEESDVDLLAKKVVKSE